MPLKFDTSSDYLQVFHDLQLEEAQTELAGSLETGTLSRVGFKLILKESYTEGNKVIIRRVVVQGNRANAYSKVIAKWGTYYFKDGQPISEQIWTVNTGQ